MATIRVTDAEVAAILDTSVVSFTPFILAASILVDVNLATPAILTDTEQLKEIARWLAAHLFAIMERQARKEETGETLAEYYGKADMGLDFTPYGQQVKVLDTSGTLANLGKKKAGFTTILGIRHAET